MERRCTKRLAALSLAAAFLFCSCSPNESILKSNTASSPPAPSNVERLIYPVEKDIEAMRTADFNFIFVLRRKDGGIFDSEDKSFVKTATSDANRHSLSDDKKAIIIGSNYKIAPEAMMKLYQRFTVEDYSKPVNEINNGRQNSNR